MRVDSHNPLFVVTHRETREHSSPRPAAHLRWPQQLLCIEFLCNKGKGGAIYNKQNYCITVLESRKPQVMDWQIARTFLLHHLMIEGQRQAKREIREVKLVFYRTQPHNRHINHSFSTPHGTIFFYFISSYFPTPFPLQLRFQHFHSFRRCIQTATRVMNYV